MTGLLVFKPDLAQARTDGPDLVLDGVRFGHHAGGDVLALDPRSVRIPNGAAMGFAEIGTAVQQAISECVRTLETEMGSP